MLFPDPASMQIGYYHFLSNKRREEPTFSMDPQERTDRYPVLEFLALKEPRGRSLLVGLACNVVICRWVRWRKPFVNVLVYLCPCTVDSVSTTEVYRWEVTDTLLPPHHLRSAAHLGGRAFSVRLPTSR